MTVLCKVCRVSSRAQRGDPVSAVTASPEGARQSRILSAAPDFWLAGLPRRLRLLAMTGLSSRAQHGDPGGCRHCEPRRGAAAQGFVGCAGFLAGLIAASAAPPRNDGVVIASAARRSSECRHCEPRRGAAAQGVVGCAGFLDKLDCFVGCAGFLDGLDCFTSFAMTKW